MGLVLTYRTGCGPAWASVGQAWAVRKITFFSQRTQSVIKRAEAERSRRVSGGPHMAAAADEVSAEAAAVGAAVDASPLGGLVYFPTALVRDQLPVGLDELAVH